MFIGSGISLNTSLWAFLVTLAPATLYDLYIWGSSTAFTLQGAAQNTPIQIGSGTDWYQIPSNSNCFVGTSGFVIDNDGKLWAWGANANGQLGLGNTTTPIASLTQVGSDVDWKDCVIQQAGNASALVKNGRLYTCGVGTSGQLANGTTSGVVSSFTQVGSDTDWAYVAQQSSGGHAIKTTGTLWGWGSRSDYRIGDGGSNSGSQTTPVQVGSDTDWVWVHRGQSGEVYARKTNGTLWSWGNNNAGKALGQGSANIDIQTPTQIGTDTDWAEVVTVVNGAIFRKTTGTLWAIGSDATNDQLGLGDGVTATSLTQIGTDTDWAKIVSGTYNGIALKTNGTVYSWGDAPALAGQGSGTTDISTPTQISGLVGVVDIWSNSGGVLCLVERP